jgi:hypothetical protein
LPWVKHQEGGPVQTTSVTIDSILPQLSSHARTALASADIVIAVDDRSQREFTIYGMPPLESTISMKQLSAMQVVRIPFEFDSHRLDELTALVRRVKGLDARPTGDKANSQSTRGKAPTP